MTSDGLPEKTKTHLPQGDNEYNTPTSESWLSNVLMTEDENLILDATSEDPGQEESEVGAGDKKVEFLCYNKEGHLRCPVDTCDLVFKGKSPKHSLTHHLKYMSVEKESCTIKYTLSLEDLQSCSEHRRIYQLMVDSRSKS